MFTFVVGRLNTDMLFAHNCGIRSLHVHTGVHTKSDVDKLLASNSLQDRDQAPTFYTPSFADVLQLYSEASS